MACLREHTRNIAVNSVAFTTVFLTILAWTSSYIVASEPSDIRAWFELHNIPEDGLQHTDSTSSLRDSNNERIWKPVSQGSGIGDTIATVGRVFKYAIPRDAFRGDISRYEVSMDVPKVGACLCYISVL